MENTTNTPTQPVAPVAPAAPAAANKNKRNLIIAGVAIAAVVIGGLVIMNQRNNSPEARAMDLLSRFGNLNDLSAIDPTKIAQEIYEETVRSAEAADRNSSREESSREESSRSSATQTRPTSTQKLPADLPNYAPVVSDAVVMFSGKTVRQGQTEYYYTLRTFGVEMNDVFEAMREELTSKGWEITEEITMTFSLYKATRGDAEVQITMTDSGTEDETESGEREVSTTITLKI